MLRKREDRRYQVIEHMKGGDGEFRLFHIAEAAEMAQKATLFAKGSLPPSSTVGRHCHEGNMELCYFLKGDGLVCEGTTRYKVGAGDVSICFDGESHQIINTGMGDLDYIVLVLNTR